MMVDSMVFTITPDDRLPACLCAVKLPEGGSVVFHTLMARRVLSVMPEGSLVRVPRKLFEALKNRKDTEYVH